MNISEMTRTIIPGIKMAVTKMSGRKLSATKPKKPGEKIWSTLYIYRFDIFNLTVLSLLIVWFLSPIYSQGHIVFSDIAFGFSSHRYLGEIWGVWNERFSTSTLLNIPRLLYILPFYLLSLLFGGSGPVLIKSFTTGLIFVSALSMYLFSKRLISVYFSREFDFFKVFALITGALYYALNPWVLFRIQHIYLLCGYSLFPLILMFFFNIFDPRFQVQLIEEYDLESGEIYRRNLLDIFLFSIIYSVSAGAIHYFFYAIIFLGVLMALLLSKLIFLQWRKDKSKIKYILRNFLYKIIITGGIFGCFSFYWLGMYVGSILMRAQASQHNINVVDTLAMFSRHSSLENVLYLISYWWPMFNINELPASFYLSGGLLLFFILYAAVFRGYRHQIVLFFTILSILFIIVSTGVEIEMFADLFVIIVTQTPIIGAMFRDPNKFIGLMTVGFSILLTFGVQDVLDRLKDNLYHLAVKMALIMLVIVSFIFYIRPVYVQYVEGFYFPVAPPEAYQDIQTKFKDPEKFDSKVMYFPVADNMTQSHTGVATPSWNINPQKDGIQKATGDVHIYSSQKNTLFHHEGNSMSISYYINFLQHVLDRGLSSELGTLFQAFGVNELAYRSEYKGHEERHAFNLQILELQKGLEKKYENDIFTLYDLHDPLPYLYVVPRKIFTPYGFSRLDSYSRMPHFNFRDFGVIFTALDNQSYIRFAGEKDYLEVRSMDDLFLSNLPQEYYWLPFEYIDDGNAFLKWSKTLAKNSEWLWFMSSQGINNYPFDFDFNSGLAVTFATNKLDVLPYKMNTVNEHAILVVDFDAMLRLEKFFVPDNPQIFNIQAYPLSKYNEFPTLKGQIIRDDPKNIWQVAKSGIIEVKEDNPYQFNIVVSGRGTDKMHVKVRFYDEEMNELDMVYVVAPREEINFDKINFYGEYVSPAGARHMRMDLLSFQRPEQKTYWWIHDINILDLEYYRQPNVFTITRSHPVTEKVHLYLRVLKNQKGGRLLVDVNGMPQNVNTLSAGLNQLEWVYLGEYDFQAGEQQISIENKEGFNSVNLLAVIPAAKKTEAFFPVQRAIEKAKIFMVLEAENDLFFEGNIQSERAYPALSMGKGLSIAEGNLSRDFDIVKSGVYSLAMFLNSNPRWGDELGISIRNKESGEEIAYQPNLEEFPAAVEIISDVVDYQYENDFFPRRLLEKEIFSHYRRLDWENITLPAGSYELAIRVKSNVPSLSTIADLDKFQADQINIPDFRLENIFQEDCSDCISIDDDMMRHRQIGGIFYIEYDPTCSCSWYYYAAEKIPVTPLEEYLFYAEVRSERVRRRHMKIFFLDEDDRIVDIAFINEVEERFQYRWNIYEQIIKVPEGTSTMQFHIWARGCKNNTGFLEIKDYKILPIRELLLLDNIILYEGQEYDSFFQTGSIAGSTEESMLGRTAGNIAESMEGNMTGSTAESIKENKKRKAGETGADIEITDTEVSEGVQTVKRIDTMKRIFYLDNPAGERVLLNFIESPNPLWQLNFGTKQRGNMVLNGVTTGFMVDSSGEGTLRIILREAYYGGLAIFFLGFIIFVFLYRRIPR